MSQRRVRVRFAPSPTGPLHVGGVRTALYNYLFARQNHGDFILRIEDTDRNRLVTGAEQYIIDSLNWLGIKPDEGIGFGDGAFAPYRQSDRKASYRQYAEKLIGSGHAYYAFDTEEELESMRKKNPNAKYDGAHRLTLRNSLSLDDESTQALIRGNHPYVIRLKVPVNEEVLFYDEIRGNLKVNTHEMDDKVLLKSDGMPTYHLANVCDDYIMQISHVIRGEEWLPSAPLHVLLYRYLGWEEAMPRFAHLPLILKPDGNGKLSKRDGDKMGFPVFPLQWTDPSNGEVSRGFRQAGYLPEAVNNMLAFLGWNPGGEKEIYSMEELISAFSMERISHGGARFDPEKSKWFNHEYIKSEPDSKLSELIRPFLKPEFKNTGKEYLIEVCRLIKDRLVLLSDIGEFDYLFEDPEYQQEDMQKTGSMKDLINIDHLSSAIIGMPYESAADIDSGLRNYASMNNIKTGDLMKFVRISLVGKLSGPPIPDLFFLLGKEASARRIRYCHSKL